MHVAQPCWRLYMSPCQPCHRAMLGTHGIEACQARAYVTVPSLPLICVTGAQSATHMCHRTLHDNHGHPCSKASCATPCALCTDPQSTHAAGFARLVTLSRCMPHPAYPAAGAAAVGAAGAGWCWYRRCWCRVGAATRALASKSRHACGAIAPLAAAVRARCRRRAAWTWCSRCLVAT